MPRSSNARFDENGFAEAVRDIEQLFMMLQDGTNDLNADASTVDADEPEGGTTGGDNTTEPADPSIPGLIYDSFGGFTLNVSTLAQLGGFTSQRLDTLGGYDTGTGVFTAPSTGTYHIQLNAAIGFVGVNAGAPVLISISDAYSAYGGTAGVPATASYPFSSGTQTNGTAYLVAHCIRPLAVGDAVTFLAGVQSSGIGAAGLSGTIAIHRLGAVAT